MAENHSLRANPESAHDFFGIKSNEDSEDLFGLLTIRNDPSRKLHTSIT